jgi:polysaccharide export outer membrane protein
MRIHFSTAVYIALVLSMMSCASYKQNIMFKITDPQAVSAQVTSAEKNYVIQKNDRLQLEVYTNRGERLVDPNKFIATEQNGTTGTQVTKEVISYLVENDGTVKFPMIDSIRLESLTIRQAEEILQKLYARYYVEPFVVLRYLNKRVIVLGAPGGQVIPLANENVRLVEVLALARGVSNDAKASNIRVLRGDKVFMSDLTTFDGYLKGNMLIEPGDIVYVEPVRRPLIEGLRDYGPVIGMATSLIAVIVVAFGR